MRLTYGLPCGHEMCQIIVEQKAISSQDIDVFWRTLHIEGDAPFTRRQSADDLLNGLFDVIRQKSDSEQLLFANMIHDMMHPEVIGIDEPVVRRHKGRSKQKLTKRDLSGCEHTKTTCFTGPKKRSSAHLQAGFWSRERSNIVRSRIDG